MKRLGSVIVIGALLAACSPSEQSPTVTGAWVRAAPPSAGMTAGYMTLSNPTDRPIRLTAVSSPAFRSIELHATVMEDGVARMREERSVTVPADGTIDFEPGGRHLMMFDATRPLAAGDTVTLMLELVAGSDEDRQVLEVDAQVRRDDGHDHQHH